ncbi:MAG: hypothetical protein VX254_00310 [Planctomycetota bacterium]|nr:hypothetical protein [Planctomycetota bacterium]
MGDNRVPLVERKDLLAEDQPARSPLRLLEVETEAGLGLRLDLQVLAQALKVNQLQQLIKTDLRKELLDLLLPDDLLELFILEVPADLVDLGEPFSR